MITCLCVVALIIWAVFLPFIYRKWRQAWSDIKEGK